MLSEVLDKLAISHFASSNERMLAATLSPKDAIKWQEKAARLSKMRFQNQDLKTGSFEVTHGRTPIVASMLLIFPCVRLDCVSSAGKPVLPMFGLRMHS